MKMKKLITILSIVLTVQCVAQDSISWRKIWVRDIGQDSVEFNERIGIKKNGVTEYSFKTTYEKFIPAFKDDIISIQNYEANKSDLQRLIEYRRDNPSIELVTIDLLLKYEIECYSDSSEVVTHECPDNMPGCLVYHTWTKTVHKEPTFKDFINWLKKKGHLR